MRDWVRKSSTLEPSKAPFRKQLEKNLASAESYVLTMQPTLLKNSTSDQVTEENVWAKTNL